MSNSFIKCLECGTVNLNRDYCSNCGNLLDLVVKRQIEREQQIQEKNQQQLKIKKKKSKIELFLKNGSDHSNILVRTLFQVFYSIWIFFAIVIGGLISMVIATAAG